MAARARVSVDEPVGRQRPAPSLAYGRLTFGRVRRIASRVQHRRRCCCVFAINCHSLSPRAGPFVPYARTEPPGSSFVPSHTQALRGDGAAGRFTFPPRSSPPDVVLVVPCHDEAARLRPDAFSAFARASPETRVLFVDDGSGDDTLTVLRALRDDHPERVDVLALPTNVGKAEAVRLGMLAGCDLDARFVAFWDADLATPLDHVAMFREVFASKPEVDMVFGARVGLLGRRIRRSMRRHYMGRVFATLASCALGMAVYDTQCGAKMFRATDELRAVLRRPFETRWVFDCEMIGRYAALRRGRDGQMPVHESIYEFPLMRWEDVAGSKVRATDVVKMAWGLWRVRLRYFGAKPWPSDRD